MGSTLRRRGMDAGCAWRPVGSARRERWQNLADLIEEIVLP